MVSPAMLPRLQAEWLAQLLGGPIPAESNATCEACAMVADETEAGTSFEQGFNPETKCCTYLPQLWNYLAGAVLDDQRVDARGRASVEARIDRGIAVTPLGLGRTRTFQVLYTTGTLTFGRSPELLCPHYLPEGGGRCGIWEHREAACSTWFCKFQRGAIGFDFWSHLNQLLGTAERILAGWALLQLGLDGSALARLYSPRRDADPKTTGRDVDASIGPSEFRAVWGAWLGREREFFRECARLVAPLQWSDVLRLGGAEVEVYARLAQDAYARLMNRTPPERPTTALVQITPRGKARVRLATYHGRDALEVPAIVGTILPYFDGRPISAAIEEIRAKEGVAIDPSLVRKLADFGVLRDAQPGGEA